MTRLGNIENREREEEVYMNELQKMYEFHLLPLRCIVHGYIYNLFPRQNHSSLLQLVTTLISLSYTPTHS